MKITKWKQVRIAGLLTCIASLPAAQVWAGESKETTESKAQPATSQVEIEIERGEGNSEKVGDDQERVTVFVDISGNKTEIVEAAIEKLERQLKASGLPEEIQRQTLESLRSNIKQRADGKKNFSVKSNLLSEEKRKKVEANVDVSKDSEANVEGTDGEYRIERKFHLPFDRQNPNAPAGMGAFPGMPGMGGMAFSFPNAMTSVNVLGPSQKAQLREAVSEALEQSGVSEEVIDRVVKRVDDVLNEISTKNQASKSSQKPPYRIGIACRPKDKDDTSPGLEVESVFEDSPAAAAGLKVGDRLVRVDNQAVESHDDIVAAVQEAGEQKRRVKLEVTRGEDVTVFEIEPNQSAIAELSVEMNHPGAFPSPAWIMQQWPNIDQNRKLLPNGLGMKQATLEDQNEKNIDEVREELADLHRELGEIKNLLKKLTDKP